MNFSIIAAVDQKMGIGINNKLPWDLKADLKHFSDISIGNKKNACIMGLNTWKSLPEKFRPLKSRLNVVLSKEPKPDLPSGVLNFQSFDEALGVLSKLNLEEIFVIGGAMLYATTIAHPACQKIYLTEIENVFDCDTFFPAMPPDFKKTEASDLQEESGVKFRFVVYERSTAA